MFGNFNEKKDYSDIGYSLIYLLLCCYDIYIRHNTPDIYGCFIDEGILKIFKIELTTVMSETCH